MLGGRCPLMKTYCLLAKLVLNDPDSSREESARTWENHQSVWFSQLWQQQLACSWVSSRRQP